MSGIPAEYHDLFEKPTFAHVATIMPDGAPHVTPVWVDYDADRDRLLVNTAKGRQKHVNVQADPRVGVSMIDPEDPYRAVSVIGEVDSTAEKGAADHIDALARRYRGTDTYSGDHSNRLILRIRADRVMTHP